MPLYTLHVSGELVHDFCGYQNLEPEIILVALSLEVLLEIMSKHMVHSLRRSESYVLQETGSQ